MGPSATGGAASGGGGASSGGGGGGTAAGGGGTTATSGAAGGGAAGAPVEMPNPLGRYRCKAPPGTTGSPRTIEEAVALLNALPKPTSVACFVESLDRPLAVFATDSVFSAQPALSAASPRVFIKTGDLWSAIVIAGDPSELIEFGYLIPGTMRSIKAELHLPLAVPVGPEAPYERVRFADGIGTSCGLCHTGERPEPVSGISSAFSSVAFKPRADSYVSVENLRSAAETCLWQIEPRRCEMLASVFGGGIVVETPFPEPMTTFF
jgi:hypothetical protein